MSSEIRSPRLSKYWQNRRVVLCGASAGLGLQLGIEVAKAQPSALILIGRNIEPLQLAGQRFEELAPHCNIECLAVDACDFGSLQRAAGQVTSNQPIDLMINAVGMSSRGSLLSCTSEDLEKLFRVNVISALHCLQAFHPMLKQAKGCGVLIGSLASLFAPRFLGGYAVAKHGLAALAQQARLEMREDNIHVMLACPGPIQRPDAGSRYREHSDANLPATAMQPGGGAKVKGLDPAVLSQEILVAAGKRKGRLVRPRSALLLHWVSSLCPSLGEAILRRKTS
jgi:short-subunit dehydrogenase